MNTYVLRDDCGEDIWWWWNNRHKYTLRKRQINESRQMIGKFQAWQCYLKNFHEMMKNLLPEWMNLVALSWLWCFSYSNYNLKKGNFLVKPLKKWDTFIIFSFIPFTTTKKRMISFKNNHHNFPLPFHFFCRWWLSL